MIQAYNYLLSSYPVKREVLYAAKSRGELKRVYDNIVSLSKSSPFYKVNLSKDNQEYTFGIKETALALKDELINMQEPKVSGFQSKAVWVSDENILSARLLNEETEAFPESIQIKVNHLANIQINRGKDLMNTSFALPMGEYRFNVSVANDTYPIVYQHQQRMGNLDAMKNVADCINQNAKGINAWVERGGTKEYSRLIIAADMTGRYGDNLFAFDEDDSAYGESIIDFFGMNRVAQGATYSSFEVNGVEKNTATNTFNLENTMQVSLNEVSTEPVTVKITADSDKILSSVDTVLQTYNNLIKLSKNRMKDSGEHYSASKMINEMKNLGKMYKDELEAVGIQVGEDGTMSLNRDRAVQAAKDGRMEELFTRKNGFITRLLDKSEAIAINPMDYVEKTVVIYPNNENKTFSNPYVTSMYSGMFFSSYC